MGPSVCTAEDLLCFDEACRLLRGRICSERGREVGHSVGIFAHWLFSSRDETRGGAD